MRDPHINLLLTNDLYFDHLILTNGSRCHPQWFSMRSSSGLERTETVRASSVDSEIALRVFKNRVIESRP